MSVVFKEVPHQVVASIRKEQPHQTLGSFISASAISLLVYAKEAGLEVAGRGFTIRHNSSEDSVDIEVCLPVNKSGQDRGDIKFHEVKGGKAASLLLEGSYDQLSEAHEKVRKWCSDNSFQWKESREVFVKGPQETKDSAAFQTEILYL